MKRSMLYLLAILPATYPSAAREVAPPLENLVTIYSQFLHPASAQSIGHMKAELELIMSPLGVHFEWRSLDHAKGDQVTAEVVVVTFKGECKTDWLPAGGPHNGALGWTHVSDGQILPFADVDCDKIRELILHPLALALPPNRDRMMGRAMARVLAHELYHFLMNTTQHSSSGIAKEYYTAAELASAELRFDYAHLRTVLQGPCRIRGLSAPIGE